ncbi:MOSC domain-containing protein [Dietzia sp. E1]|uniref:MOSC domain-containing protein n=1 Tax=Dietzia sp. E1 TaxID=328361 RepID=UPI0015FD795C|nr:MOSC N-terminal beta barrel domain-containing protein [Dietzia sp. E1]MBB1021057.1 MOSC domain-containing protein [Dietzia sp. E1]
MRVGTVSELWRYPVKSMRGDRVDETAVTERWGLPGDRGWVIRDEDAGELRSAKKWAELLQFHARYVEEPQDDATPTIEIDFPDGSSMRSDDDTVHEALSAALGRRVTLWPRRPVDDHEHYRRRAVDEADLRTQLGLGPDDPFPAYSGMPEDLLTELSYYATPRGTYFDAMPLSLLTSTAMASLQAAVPDAVIDPRRFRKNLIVTHEPGGDGHPEFDWVGRRLMIGEVTCEVVMRISRCRMVTLPQADLPHDRSVLRSLARDNGAEFGVYLRALSPGTIREGDEVRLL